MGDDRDNQMILIYACSGGANVGELADRAARMLMAAGEGTMFCLAGVGGGIEEMVRTAREADVNVLIDGCDVDCAKATFDRAGVTNYVQVKVTDLGITKAKGVPIRDEDVDTVVAEVKNRLVS